MAGGLPRVYAAAASARACSTGSGAIVPANTTLLIPEPNEPSTGLMHATFTQFLSPRFGVTAGKIYTLDDPPASSRATTARSF